MKSKQTEIAEMRSLCQRLLTALRTIKPHLEWSDEQLELLKQAEEKLDMSGKHCWLDEDPDVSLPCECVFDNDEPLENCCIALQVRDNSEGKHSCPYYGSEKVSE